ncbi:MAG: type II toxin-antitoxin system RelE/ParE family toxin [Actinomycetota bacterium]
MTRGRGPVRRRWRDYETPAGHRPVRDFISSLPEGDAAEIAAAMKEVAMQGFVLARHLRGEIWEVRAFSETKGYRILFAPEGSKGRILLALDAFAKKTQKTPERLLQLAERRLADWRRRGKRMR